MCTRSFINIIINVQKLAKKSNIHNRCRRRSSTLRKAFPVRKNNLIRQTEVELYGI